VKIYICTIIKVYVNFNKHVYKNKKSKLYFGDRVAILNDWIYEYGGSTFFCYVCGHKYICMCIAK
jgi:hypothetical protein